MSQGARKGCFQGRSPVIALLAPEKRLRNPGFYLVVRHPLPRFAARFPALEGPGTAS